MGYYTKFGTISFVFNKSVFRGLDIQPEHVHSMIKTKLESISGYNFDYGDFDFREGVYSVCLELNESCKWYDWRKDLKNMSLYIPNCEIFISGIGEESDDIWEAVFKNGHGSVSFAEMVFWTSREVIEERKNVLENEVVTNTSCIADEYKKEVDRVNKEAMDAALEDLKLAQDLFDKARLRVKKLNGK